MKVWHLRPARSADLPGLARLLPSWELEAAAVADDDKDDRLLLAFSGGSADSAAPPLGCIRLRRQIGAVQPRYWFHLGYRVHAAAELGMFRRERTLLLGNDHTGAAELADLCIDAARLQPAQRARMPRLLVRSALLLLQRDRRLQPAAAASMPRVIATLPGRRDESGAAPFWEGLGRHFYPGNVDQALARFGNYWRTHVAALLPRHPLVVSVLHEDAQDAIGAVHPDAEALLEALSECGMRAGQHVDLFDAGPVYESQLDLLDSHQPLAYCQLRLRAQLDRPTPLLIAGERNDEVWQVPGMVDAAGGLSLTTETAAQLGWVEAQSLWVSGRGDS